MRAARLALPLLLMAGAAAAAPGCPALPRTFPLPREASAEELPSDEWRQRRGWMDNTLAQVQRAQVQLAYIGDSITEAWDPQVFYQFNARRGAVNLGLWGDQTGGALYRLAHNQWDGLQPKVAVVLIGTNNLTWGHSPANVALGVAEIVRFIQERSPRTKVLVLGLLPRGAMPNDPMRAQVRAVNALIARCADNESVFYLDVGRYVLEADGRMADHISGDKLHLSPVGYALITAAIEPLLQRLLGEVTNPPGRPLLRR